MEVIQQQNSIVPASNFLARKPQKPQQRAKKEKIYEQFVEWMATPAPEQKRQGIETMQAFADYYNTAIRTLSNWKTMPDFWPRVEDKRRHWANGRTSNVVNAIYNSAVKGNALSQSLWMQCFGGLDPRGKQDDKNKQPKVEISVRDIRFMIEQLPAERKVFYYGIMRDLFLELDSVRTAREVEIDDDNYMDEPSGATGAIQGDATHDAQEVPNKKANGVPRSYQSRLCEDMGREVPTCNHKSTSWWWKEQTAR